MTTVWERERLFQRSGGGFCQSLDMNQIANKRFTPSSFFGLLLLQRKRGLYDLLTLSSLRLVQVISKAICLEFVTD